MAVSYARTVVCNQTLRFWERRAICNSEVANAARIEKRIELTCAAVTRVARVLTDHSVVFVSGSA